MKKEVSTPVIAGVIVAVCLFLGFMASRFLVPQRVILPKGAVIPPRPDYRTGENVPGRGPVVPPPPNYRTGETGPSLGR